MTCCVVFVGVCVHFLCSVFLVIFVVCVYYVVFVFACFFVFWGWTVFGGCCFHVAVSFYSMHDD